MNSWISDFKRYVLQNLFFRGTNKPSLRKWQNSTEESDTGGTSNKISKSFSLLKDSNLLARICWAIYHIIEAKIQVSASLLFGARFSRSFPKSETLTSRVKRNVVRPYFFLSFHLIFYWKVVENLQRRIRKKLRHILSQLYRKQLRTHYSHWKPSVITC